MPIQALFFDLDDTLMDTYGQLVLRAHQEACQAMNQAGLSVPVEQLLDVRLQLTRSSPREDINSLLAHHFNCDNTAVIQAGLQAYYNTDIQGIQMFPGAKEMLEELSQFHFLYLVTSGSPITQAGKVKELGIQSLFCDIIYVDITNSSSSKHQAFSHLMKHQGLLPKQVAVIGDRIHGEIRDANHLGCHTVWVKHGEFSHVHPITPDEEPDAIIEDIRELKQALHRLQTVGVS